MFRIDLDVVLMKHRVRIETKFLINLLIQFRIKCVNIINVSVILLNNVLGFDSYHFLRNLYGSRVVLGMF